MRNRKCNICKKDDVYYKGNICFNCKYTIQEKDSNYRMPEEKMNAIIAAHDNKDYTLLGELFTSFYHFDFHESFRSKDLTVYTLAALKEFFIYIPNCDRALFWKGIASYSNDFYHTIKHVLHAQAKEETNS